MRQVAAEKVSMLCDYISFLSNKDVDSETKKKYKSKALGLFVSDGKEYEENGIQKPCVMIEIASPNRPSVSQKLTREYLNSLISLRYNEVKITATEPQNINVSHIDKIDDIQHECTCQCEMVVIGTRYQKNLGREVITKQI